jgi:hypothetical protein
MSTHSQESLGGKTNILPESFQVDTLSFRRLALDRIVRNFACQFRGESEFEHKRIVRQG